MTIGGGQPLLQGVYRPPRPVVFTSFGVHVLMWEFRPPPPLVIHTQVIMSLDVLAVTYGKKGDTSEDFARLGCSP